MMFYHLTIDTHLSINIPQSLTVCLRITMFLTLLSTLLLTTCSLVTSLPRISSSHTNNHLPSEDLISDWLNPWNFPPAFPRADQPNRATLASLGLGLTPSYLRQGQQDSSLPMKRAGHPSNYFRFLGNSIDGREGERFFMKRNYVPMLG